ncbi:universal stress protein [Flagellimonas meridianipacifica]|uniref:Nucleotide-binding universal stress UspA family protein n=1 Tax=Flagellimonas meridianipacifica TaxID=1080225 RepID=A0A2T0MD52_9FLAO|nr:universal stress protein [Allomuricauda pacifica]PRX55419.1 nucleotide-binding universal stress UspA family protein [Allomuricauda pacifica]
MNKILVPVDFSDTSSNALLYAIQLFGESDLEITVLHTYGVQSTAALLMKNIDGVLEKDAKLEMDKLLNKFQKDFPDVVFSSKITKNSPISTIVALGDTGNFDFIVMGTKGASGLKEVFMGSVAGGVISKTSAPVIVVPDGHTFRPLKEIVFAVSDDPFSDDQVIEPLRRIAVEHQSKVKVLHIAEEKTPQIEKALQAIEDLNPSVDYAFGTGDTHTDLNDYLLRDFAGLLCLIRTKKGFIERLLNESVTLKQTFNSPIPLLILHD